MSNLLLVLGCAFLAGGYKHQLQEYSKVAASANVGTAWSHCRRVPDSWLCAGLLLLALMSVLFPSALTATGQVRSSCTGFLRNPA